MATTTPSRTGVSPTSSPRLPSPPPFTEVQFGPKSPGIGGSITELQLEADGKQDDGASRRIRPGSKAVDMAKGPPFVPLHQVESPFQLQEYLKSLYHSLTHDDASNTTRPVTKEMATELAAPPTAQDTGEVIDRNLWLYELCRFLCSKTTRMIVAFFADNPPCSSITCPEMRASEWQYLCAVHEPPKSCCAIDYCNHTLDWASNVLTSTKHFPSRLSLGGEGGNAYQSMRQLTNIFRRVYRIYAHAWFQHREVFWAIEAELGLYLFFKTVCDVYQLIPEDNYTIPPEAEGDREENLQTPVSTSSPQRVAILQKSVEQQLPDPSQDTANTLLTRGATTRRHKHTPSTGVPVPAIAEGAEEEEDLSKTTTIEGRASKSPKKFSEIERSNTPGRIDLPVNLEPERAPEDPTPIASHETSPFGPPLTTMKTSSQMVEPNQPNLGVPAPAVTGSSPAAEIATSQSQPSNTIQTSRETNEPNAIDSDEETQIAIEESPQRSRAGQHEKEEEGNETMERIEVPDSLKQTAPEISNLDKVQTTAAATKGDAGTQGAEEKQISSDGS